MRRSPYLVALGVLSASLVLLVRSEAAPKKAPAPVAHTYTVLVGAENPHRGISINAYFLDTVTIHVGDTVLWQQNSNEIHTVTFLAGTEPAPLLIPAVDAGVPPTPSPLLFNPVVVNPAGPVDSLYDGTTYTLMIGDMTPGPEPYICLFHDSSGMEGTLIVLPR